MDREPNCYTDTDSLLLVVVTPDVYADMAASSRLYTIDRVIHWLVELFL